MQRLLRAGISEAKVLLDRVIAGETTIHVRDFDGSPEPLTQESLQWCMGAWWPDQRARLSGMPLGLDALRSLVEADWQRIQQGTPPTMVAGDSDLPWGDLTTYSRGWVRVR